MSERVDWDRKVGPEALTFDDVLLVPRLSEAHPREVSTRTRRPSRTPRTSTRIGSRCSASHRFATSAGS